MPLTLKGDKASIFYDEIIFLFFSPLGGWGLHKSQLQHRHFAHHTPVPGRIPHYRNTNFVHTFYRPRAWGDGSDAPSWGSTAQTAEISAKLAEAARSSAELGETVRR